MCFAVKEIKKSINGEINKFHQGSPAIFVRFQGCSLHETPCAFCDTQHAIEPASIASLTPRTMSYSIDDLYNILKYRQNLVTVLTGGEPLFQGKEKIIGLLEKLSGYKIVIETNGTYDVSDIVKIFPEVNIVMDYKPISAKNNHRMVDDYYKSLRNTDIIKFPFVDHKDFELIVKKAREFSKFTNCIKAISPVFNHNKFAQKDINEFIQYAIEENLYVSVQIHKLLGVY